MLVTKVFFNNIEILSYSFKNNFWVKKLNFESQKGGAGIISNNSSQMLDKITLNSIFVIYYESDIKKGPSTIGLAKQNNQPKSKFRT